MHPIEMKIKQLIDKAERAEGSEREAAYAELEKLANRLERMVSSSVPMPTLH